MFALHQEPKPPLASSYPTSSTVPLTIRYPSNPPASTKTNRGLPITSLHHHTSLPSASNKPNLVITTPIAQTAFLATTLQPITLTGKISQKSQHPMANRHRSLNGRAPTPHFSTSSIFCSSSSDSSLLLAGNEPYAVLGSAGANGGNYNAAISACSPSTSIVNYTNQVRRTRPAPAQRAVPVYKTVNSCANIANISFNQAPDILVKAAFDPGWGHYEVFGIAGFAHETVYPGETTNSNLYGGLKDIVTGAGRLRPALTTAGLLLQQHRPRWLGRQPARPVHTDKLTSAPKASTDPAWAATATPRWPMLPPMPPVGFHPIHNSQRPVHR